MRALAPVGAAEGRRPASKPGEPAPGPPVTMLGISRGLLRSAPADVLVVCAYVAAAAVRLTSGASLHILGGAGLIMALRGRRIGRENDLLLPVGLFLASTLLSTLQSVDLARSLQLSVPLLPGFLVFLLVSSGFEARHVRMLYMTFSVVAVATGAMLLLEAVRDPTGTPTAWTDSANSPLFVVRNDVLFFAAVAPLSLALFGGSARGSGGLGLASVVVGVAVTIVFRSRGAALTSLMVVPLTVLLSRRSWTKGLAMLAAILFLGFALDGALGFALTRRLAHSWTSRVPIWLAAAQMFRDAPLLGNGPHVFGELFDGYFWVHAWATSDFYHTAWAHNLYLELLAEQGILGAGAFVLILHRVFRSVRNLLHSEHPEVQALASGAAASVAAICLGGVFEASFLRMWVVLVIFSVLGSVAALAASDRHRAR